MRINIIALYLRKLNLYNYEKSTFISFVVALILVSCSSNEDKAEKLVSDCIKDYLTYPESYEAISTRIDSSWINAPKIVEVIELTKEVAKLNSEIESIERSIESAQTTMEIYAPTRFYNSEHSRGEYNRAKAEIEEHKIDLEKLTSKLNGKISVLRNSVSNVHAEEFKGWAVTHRFRSKGENGVQMAPEEMIFFCDMEFERCQGWTSKQYELISNIIKKISESDTDRDILRNISGLQYFL